MIKLYFDAHIPPSCNIGFSMGDSENGWEFSLGLIIFTITIEV